MLHDDIEAVRVIVERQQAEMQELAATLTEALKRLDAVEKMANPAQAVLTRMTKPAKDSK